MGLYARRASGVCVTLFHFGKPGVSGVAGINGSGVLGTPGKFISSTERPDASK